MSASRAIIVDSGSSGARSGGSQDWGEVLLLTPGPTPIHPAALAAMQWPMRGHMDEEVLEFNEGLARMIRELYGSEPDSFAALLSGTGSLAMEAGLSNLLEAGDRVLIVVNGVFGERMAAMATRLGAAVEICRYPLGSEVDLSEVRERALRTSPKLLAVVHGETSSGVMNPVPELGEVAREAGALFMVDAVTTVGMLPFHAGEWGVDYAFTGSQKCLSAPPGVAPVVFSARAMETISDRSTPVSSWYSDALGMRDYWERGPHGHRYHHTVPVQLHWATGEAMRVALEEGMAARASRAGRLAAAVAATLDPLGFAPLVPAAYRLPTVLTLTLPVGLDDEGVRRELRRHHAISVAGGLGELSGRIWRLGLMGENARRAHYHRLMETLGRVLHAPELPGRFEKSLGDG